MLIRDKARRLRDSLLAQVPLREGQRSDAEQVETSNKVGLKISHLVPDIRLRRYCKWHQKQVKVAGEWKYQPRLVSWYGPCEYEVTHPNTLRRAAEWLALIVVQYPLRTLVSEARSIFSLADSQWRRT